jgi:uncharacterized protein YjbI with pentapeptide repeats
LKQGVESWNQWREQNPKIRPELAGADLTNIDLQGVNLKDGKLFGSRLTGAVLRGANLRRVDLAGANLTGVDLQGADLRRADLRESNLSKANLSYTQLGATNLNGATLNDTDLKGCRMSNTCLGNLNLQAARGIDSIMHAGPSSIDIATIYRSNGMIPKAFLRGVGVPDSFIECMHSLVNATVDFHSCFISYSNEDRKFAERLYGDLQAKGVRCWYFPQDARGGEPVWGEIDGSIKDHDKLVVICSANSLQSVPVSCEIERALQREDREKCHILFPISLDEHLFGVWEHPRKADVLSRVVTDFRDWESESLYQKSFDRLLRDLRTRDKAKSDFQA